MKIDADLMLELRTANAWSQDELAIAAGLNPRTVQRIEREGQASLQSKKALASAFGVDVGELDYKEKPKIMKYEYKVLKFDIKGWISSKVDSVDMEAQLNECGAKGWDLVKVSEILGDMAVTKMLVATLKRPVE